MSLDALFAQLTPTEDSYARSVIAADLMRQQQLTAVRDFMAALALARHEPGLSVDHDDNQLRINREESRVEFEVSSDATIDAAGHPRYMLALDEQWEKTMKRPAVVRPVLRTDSSALAIERIARVYLRFRNNIHTFEHDLSIATAAPTRSL